MKDIINTINTASAYRTILAELHLNERTLRRYLRV